MGINMITTIRVFKAQPAGDKEVPGINISISEEYSPDNSHITEKNDFFVKEAKLICDSLHESLPGGTFDALTVALLDIVRSRLVVRH
jgi:hypothetical protein